MQKLFRDGEEIQPDQVRHCHGLPCQRGEAPRPQEPPCRRKQLFQGSSQIPQREGILPSRRRWTNFRQTVGLDSLKATLSWLNSSPRLHEIWTAVRSWVLYDARNRSKFLSDLMVLARVSQLGTDFKKQVVPVLTKCKFSRQEVVAMLQVLLGTKSASLDLESNFDKCFAENLA